MKNIMNKVKEAVKNNKKKVAVGIGVIVLIAVGTTVSVLSGNNKKTENTVVENVSKEQENKKQVEEKQEQKQEDKKQEKEKKEENKKIENNSVQNTQSNNVQSNNKKSCKVIHHEAKTHIVKHKEQGHYVKKLVDEAWDEGVYEYRPVGGITGHVYDNIDDYHNQQQSGQRNENYSIRRVKVGVKHHPATYEKKWVVDKKAYTETVVDKPAWNETVCE